MLAGCHWIAGTFLAQAKPKQTPAFQWPGQAVGWQCAQQLGCPLPVLAQKRSAGPIPLQLPAVAITGPSLQNCDRSGTTVEPDSRCSHGGGVCRQLFWDGVDERWVGEQGCHQQPHRLQAVWAVRVLLDEIQQQPLALLLLVAAALEQHASNREHRVLAFWTTLNTGQGVIAIAEHAQSPGQLLAFSGCWSRCGTGLAHPCLRPGPAPSPARQMDGTPMPLCVIRLQAHGCGQRGRVRWLSLQQLLVMFREPLAGSGADRLIRKPFQHLAPQGFGCADVTLLVGGFRRQAERHGGERVIPPALGCLHRTRAGHQQCGFPAALGVDGPAEGSPQLGRRGRWAEG